MAFVTNFVKTNPLKTVGGLFTIIAILFLWVVIRPFDSQSDPDQDDVAEAWNKSIGRLGIQPVFPPEEDFHVGDIWAVVVYGDASTSTKLPLLGKAVRIAHIDLRPEILGSYAGLPLFDETVDMKEAEKFRRQPKRTEVGGTSGNLITLSLTGFPGISISHSSQATSSAGTGWLGFGGGRQGRQSEELRIPTAETYGAPAEAAFRRLKKWCVDKATSYYCANDKAARLLLAYAIGNQLLDVTGDDDNKKYVHQVQLSLVTRVFLTREIQQRRQLTDDRGLLVQLPAAPNKPADNTAPVSDPSKATTLSSIDRIVSVASGDSKISTLRADGIDIGFSQVFQRPVAFGFRSIDIQLDPVPPEKKKVTP